MARGDEVWSAWLAALGDPRHELRIGICGRVRDAHWDMGRRVLPEHMLHLVIDGGHEGLVDGRQVRSGPGDILWVPSGTEQVLRKRSDARCLAKDFVRFTLAGTAPPPLPTVLHAPAAGELLVRLRAEWLARLPGRDERLRALLVLLFSELWRGTGQRRRGFDAATQARVVALADRDAAARPTPAQLAREAGMSPAWFSRLFRRTFGCAPRTWLMRHRIARAAERLGPGTTVGVVATEFGYADLFLFSRQFRAVMGVSPRMWLRQRRG